MRQDAADVRPSSEELLQMLRDAAWSFALPSEAARKFWLDNFRELVPTNFFSAVPLIP